MKRAVVGTLLVLLLFLTGGPAWGAETEAGLPVAPQLDIQAPPSEARVGEVVTLTLRYLLPEGARWEETTALSGMEGLTVLSLTPRPPSPIRAETPPGVQGGMEVRILVDRLDTLTIGPLSLSYQDRDGQVHEVYGGPVQVAVIPMLGENPEEAPLRPISGIIPTRPWWKGMLPWAGALAALVLAGALLLWWRRRRRSKPRSIPFQEVPHILAMQELEALLAGGLFERGEVKAFYFRFSEILRRYIESLRGIPAAEYTTEEIAKVLRNTPDEVILPVLGQADLVKFANWVPPPAHKQDHVERALAYIRKTGIPKHEDPTSGGRT